EGDQLVVSLSEAGDHGIELAGTAGWRRTAKNDSRVDGLSGSLPLGKRFFDQGKRRFARVVENEERFDFSRITVIECGAYILFDAGVESLDRTHHAERRIAFESRRMGPSTDGEPLPSVSAPNPVQPCCGQ